MKKTKNYIFDVVVTLQGQPHHNYKRTLLGALFKYAYEYLKGKKYGRFTLRQVFKR